MLSLARGRHLLSVQTTKSCRLEPILPVFAGESGFLLSNLEALSSIDENHLELPPPLRGSSLQEEGEGRVVCEGYLL